MSDRYVHAVIQRHFPPTVIDTGEHRGDYACKCGMLIAGGADGAFWVAHLLQEIDDAALDVTFKTLPLSHLEAHDGKMRAAWEAWKALPSSEQSRRRLAAASSTEGADSYYPDGDTYGTWLTTDCMECDAKRREHLTGAEFFISRMILCPECGDKRCPKAVSHQNDCNKK